MISVDQLLAQHLPRLQDHPWLNKPLAALLRHLLHEQNFQRFAADYPHLEGFPFIEKVLELFDFSYALRDNERERIPSRGRVVIIANHPIGSLDGLALLNLVGSIRRDVKAVANDLLWSVAPLRQLLLPVTVLGGSSGQSQLRALGEHLQQEGALIIFPAGEVSRLSPQGVRDGHWQGGFLKLAGQARAPIVPIHIDGRNSALFYGASMLYKPLATLLLVKEMFKQQRKSIDLRIGHPIPFASYSGSQLTAKAKVKLFRRHLYRLAKDKSPLFRTATAIAHPVDRSELSQALRHCQQLGATPDGKQILLFEGGLDTPILRELGRLREIAFRAVGEGSGKRRDLDRFDSYYQHLLLWDPQELEIAGAYRLAAAGPLIQQRGLAGLYTSTLFDFDPQLVPILEQGLELGRSFVQPRYWGKRSLDYLWYGIGAYLRRYPQYRYLFGPVSLSKELPDAGKALLIAFYRCYFPAPAGLARHRQPYRSDDNLELSVHFSGQDYATDFARLKEMLAHMGCSVPTLYKQYSELTEAGGVQFLDFGTDPDFAGCIDGLVLVDSQRFKPSRRARYLGEVEVTPSTGSC